LFFLNKVSHGDLFFIGRSILKAITLEMLADYRAFLQNRANAPVARNNNDKTKIIIV